MLVRSSVLVITFLIFGISRCAYGDLIQFGSGSNQFGMDFVEIGNPGNPADTRYPSGGRGAVAYTFQMSTYEVSREMITKVNALSGLTLTLADMTGLGGNGNNKPQLELAGMRPHDS